jgi:hypothetical protein
MATYSPSDSPVFESFFSPVIDVYRDSLRKYNCTTLSDLDFLEMGTLRCLSDSQTGRDFVQRHGDFGRIEIDVDLFFKSLKSQRRIDNLTSVNQLTSPLLEAAVVDPFAEIPELDTFAIYAGDGHFHAAAVHDPKDICSSGELRKLATGHFFTLNLRTHFLNHLGTSDLRDERKGEHDMHLIKRSKIDQLRGGEPKGTKAILVWDKAGIDFRFWHKVKMSSGLYFISREKSNMKLIPCGEKLFDRRDPRNNGVMSDEDVEPGSGGAMLRRIIYKDPETGKEFRFITTEMTLPPGIVCLLYKARWDIEKVFDEAKNKMLERKSWGSGDQSKTANALFICLAHNLMVLLEEALRTDEWIENDTELERRDSRKETAIRKGANFVATFLQRCTVRSVKFLRWLRNFVYREVPWSNAVARLRQIYAIY